MEVDDDGSTNPDQQESHDPSKKVRLFSAKEFRSKLGSPEKRYALQEFLDLCNSSRNYDYVIEYLESGGNCLELLQLLETGTEVPASLILEVVNHVLLQIVSNHAQFHAAANESCSYFLNSHMALVNKMLSLGSTSKERKIVLKLLTTMVTFSRKLAKEVLLHVNFNPTNLEVLAKQTGEKDGVRNAFVHFLISFLVEGESPTISILLEKKALLASIMNGLQFDPADTVCIVMTTLKMHVLENPYVSRTQKMNIFSTPVIKDIVNLYNWKGPQGFGAKKKLQTAVVDEHDKSRVNESVHNFLLVLCSSHKFGVIFRDRQLGLDKGMNNSLMYTVLESLDKPWEHSYAGELVTKICEACPELARTMWSNLKTFLEPRPTAQWFSAVKYAATLVKELEPAAIDFCARDLSVFQLAQVIQFLIAPTPILKTIIPENHIFESSVVKHLVLSVLLEFLKAMQTYMVAAANWAKPKDLRTLKNLLSKHVARNFPNAQSVLADWTKLDDSESYTVLNHIELILELLNLYESMCPPLLESLSSAELASILKEIEGLPEQEHIARLQVRAIKLFVNFESSMFAPSGDLFVLGLPLVLGYYYETKDSSAKETLNLLLKNAGIFEGCTEEIGVWVNGIFDLSALDASTGQTIVEIIKQASGNIFKYLFAMPKFWQDTEFQVERQNFKDILENLRADSLPQSSVGLSVKHRGLSPLLLATLDYLQDVDQSKNFKNYFSSVIVNLLHFQTTPSILGAIISSEKYKGLVSKYVLSYVKGWASSESSVLIKTKAYLAQDLSSSFLEGDVDRFFETHKDEIDVRPDQAQNCLNQALFYFTNLSVEKLTESHANNCVKVVKFLVDRQKYEEVAASVFENPILLRRFSPLHQGLTTVFLVDVIKQLQNLEMARSVDGHLKPFRAKLAAAVRKVLKKSGKKSAKSVHLMEALEVFGLEHQQCLDVLSFWSQLDVNDLDADFVPFYYNLLVYTLKFLNRVDNQEPLDNHIIPAIARLLIFLNKNMDQFDGSACANAFRNYLETFPHNLVDVGPDLFESILVKAEFCKESALLAGFLLRKRSDLLDLFVKNLPSIANKKGLMLVLLDAVNAAKADEALAAAYKVFEPTVLKGLQKPKKAGQHFETYQDVLVVLISSFMPENVCRPYVDKVQKFDTSEAFHVRMLVAIFNKIVFQSDHDLSKRLNNSFLTLVHATNFLFRKKDKSEDDWAKLNAIIKSTSEFCDKIIGSEMGAKVSFRTLCENENFQLYCKFCLKFGLSGNAMLVKLVKSLARFVDFEESEAREILEMAGSHSEFLELILNEDGGECKLELLDLVLGLCQRWPALMQRNHVPVLLAAYRATVAPSDRIVLILLQMYEKAANKTNFYDFKPFLWGTAAATHYSVRQDIQKALWRQPKMGDILDILQEDWVLNTVANYPLDTGLTATKIKTSNPQNVYDLAFFMPLFSSMLAPEIEVATYKFTKSGALSLTVVALSSNDKELRLAACHVLARYHYHLEAKQGGKDKLVWLRFVEAICRGTAVLDDFKLNNFAAIFWARMALILTRPLQPLYVPLCNYLGAKVAPDLRAVPELYTFLHSPDVNYKEMRTFILEILRDGLRTDADFSVALRAMAFKLIMEQFSSCVVDLGTKTLLLAVVERACRLNLGRRLLCSSYGLLSWLYELSANLNYNEDAILSLVIQILVNVTKNVNSSKTIDYNLVSLIVTSIIDRNLISSLRKDDLNYFLQVVLDLFDINCKFLSEVRLRALINVTSNKKCEYLLKYGCTFFVTVENVKETEELIELIVTKWINK